MMEMKLRVFCMDGELPIELMEEFEGYETYYSSDIFLITWKGSEISKLIKKLGMYTHRIKQIYINSASFVNMR